MNNGSLAPAGRTRRETAHLAVECEPGSRAAQRPDDVARDAERVFAKLLKVLQVPGEAMLRPHRVTVVVGDTPPTFQAEGSSTAAGTTSDLARDTVTTTYHPDGLASDLCEHLARVVLHRLTATIPTDARLSDAQAGSIEAQRFFLDGAATYLGHLAINGEKAVSAELDAADDFCRQYAATHKWRLPLYQAIVRGADAVDDLELFAAMREGFSAYLAQRDGSREFLRFLSGVRRDPNHSAEIIYGKSLELLEREWIVHLRGDAGRRLISLWEFLVRVWPWLKPYPWRQVECLALMLIGSISTQVAPYQIRNLVDLLNSPQVRSDPWDYGLVQLGWILVVMTVAGLFNLCSIVRLVYVVNVLGQNILRDMREQYIDKVNGLPASYFAGARTGDLMARFTSDMSRLADPLARTTAYSVYYIILLVVSFVGLIGLSPQLTLVLLLIVPVYIFISRLLGPPIQRVTRGRQERLAQINSHMEELVVAHPIIQIFNLQRFMGQRTNPEIREFRRVEIRGDFLRAVFEEASDIADLLSTRIVWLVGGILVLATWDPAVAAVTGTITLGTVVGFNALMGRFILPVHRLANIYSGIAVAAAALRRIEEILHAEPERLDVPAGGTDRPPAVREGIELENVGFAYGLKPVLKDISLSIPAGTSAAFVGPTGAGKTTLVNMIPRLYEPASGTIRIDGRDTRDFSLPALRSAVALVSQENFLFNASVRENIAFGSVGATDDQIVEAAKSAHIHDFVMSLPAGYDTIVGERGSRFSGGQRQRLAIARALLRDAPILILDEATSALDAETEHEILEELAAVTAGKTVISITHRLALAMRCDVIYVLDQGQIVERGTHDELLAQHGLYRRLFEDQNEALLQSGLVPTARMGADTEGSRGNGAAHPPGDGAARPTGGEAAATAPA